MFFRQMGEYRNRPCNSVQINQIRRLASAFPFVFKVMRGSADA